MIGRTRLAGAVLAAAILPVSARAEDLVATRPGIMCASPDALAKLTLPNGDSRTHAPDKRPADLATASSGGCIDIPLGARVTVQQAFHNTSRVTYAGPGAPADGAMTVPNIDFQRSGDAVSTSAGPMPPGYAAAKSIPVGNGDTLVLLLDRRLTPALQKALWHHGDDYDEAFYGQPAVIADFTKRPPVDATIELQDPSGQTVARRGLQRPLARIEPLQPSGTLSQTFVLLVDWTTGSSFYGPFGELLAPVGHGLTALQAVPVHGGKAESISLDSTNHADWKLIASPQGGSPAIQAWNCSMDTRMDLRTYRLTGDAWTVAHRSPPGDCREVEDFPPRREFP